MMDKSWTIPAYRLGFAVKVLGSGGLSTADLRRRQNGPHLRRSAELLDVVFDYLDRIDVRVYRLSSSTVPYGTHPDSPEFDYRRQIADAAPALAALGAKARSYGLRLSTHPGQYTVLNALDDEIARKARLDVEQDALLLDALEVPAEGVVVIHVGGLYGDKAAALDRWVVAYERLSEGARRRLVVEHDETSFTLEDVLELHARTGVPVVYDLHHDRCNPSHATLADAYASWPHGVRPKAHLSSPRTEFRGTKRGTLPPLVAQHADFATPWDLAALLRSAPAPLDVMVEAKAKDLAVLYLRTALGRFAPDVAAREQRHETRAPTAQSRTVEEVLIHPGTA